MRLSIAVGTKLRMSMGSSVTSVFAIWIGVGAM